MVGIEGSTAIITGGTRGIGLAAARGLGALGATVVLIGQDASRAAAAAVSLQEQGIDAIGAACDVTDHDGLSALASELGPLGEADILIASAGVMSERMSKTLRTTAAEWQRVRSINVDGVFNAMSVFGPGMVERRVGRIIAVSACLGRFTGPQEQHRVCAAPVAGRSRIAGSGLLPDRWLQAAAGAVPPARRVHAATPGR